MQKPIDKTATPIKVEVTTRTVNVLDELEHIVKYCKINATVSNKEAERLLMIMSDRFSQLKNATHKNKQRDMIQVVVGGLIAALIATDNKPGSDRPKFYTNSPMLKAINLIPKETRPIKRLFKIGALALENIPTSFNADVFNAAITLEGVPPIVFFEGLAKNEKEDSDRMGVFVKFLTAYKTILNATQFTVKKVSKIYKLETPKETKNTTAEKLTPNKSNSFAFIYRIIDSIRNFFAGLFNKTPGKTTTTTTTVKTTAAVVKNSTGTFQLFNENRLAEFNFRHTDKLNSGTFKFFNKTNLISKEQRTPDVVLAHAKETTFFGFKNRTCLVLEEMGIEIPNNQNSAMKK